MTNNIEDGITQKTMSLLANISASTVSRFIASNDIAHYNTGGQRYLRYSVEDTRNIIRNLSSFPEKIIKHKKRWI